jgi:hypothetical protein
MDLIEFHKSYVKGVSGSLTILWRSLAILRDQPENRRALDLAFRAAHAIKGSSWTMREAPCALNDEPPDTLYDAAAIAAEALETHLALALENTQGVEQNFLIQQLANIEMAVAEASVRLNPEIESVPDVP